MVAEHLTDDELQQLLFDRPAASAAARAHYRTCPPCQARARAYTQFFAAVHELPPPRVSFDLEAAVLARLPLPGPARLSRWPDRLVGVSVALGTVVAVVVGSVSVRLAGSLGGTGALLAPLLVGGGVLLVLAGARELTQVYRQKLRQLADLQQSPAYGV